MNNEHIQSKITKLKQLYNKKLSDPKKTDELHLAAGKLINLYEGILIGVTAYEDVVDEIVYLLQCLKPLEDELCAEEKEKKIKEYNFSKPSAPKPIVQQPYIQPSYVPEPTPTRRNWGADLWDGICYFFSRYVKVIMIIILILALVGSAIAIGVCVDWGKKETPPVIEEKPPIVEDAIRIDGLDKVAIKNNTLLEYTCIVYNNEVDISNSSQLKVTATSSDETVQLGLKIIEGRGVVVDIFADHSLTATMTIKVEYKDIILEHLVEIVIDGKVDSIDSMTALDGIVLNEIISGSSFSVNIECTPNTFIPDIIITVEDTSILSYDEGTKTFTAHKIGETLIAVTSKHDSSVKLEKRVVVVLGDSEIRQIVIDKLGLPNDHVITQADLDRIADISLINRSNEELNLTKYNVFKNLVTINISDSKIGTLYVRGLKNAAVVALNTVEVGEINVSNCPELREISWRGSVDSMNIVDHSVITISAPSKSFVAKNVEKLMFLDSAVMTCSRIEIVDVSVIASKIGSQEIIMRDLVLGDSVTDLHLEQVSSIRNIVYNGSDKKVLDKLVLKNLVNLSALPQNVVSSNILELKDILSPPNDAIGLMLSRAKTVVLDNVKLPDNYEMIIGNNIKALTIISCPTLARLSLSGGTDLSSLTIEKCIALTNVDIGYNIQSSLDVSIALNMLDKLEHFKIANTKTLNLIIESTDVLSNIELLSCGIVDNLVLPNSLINLITRATHFAFSAGGLDKLQTLDIEGNDKLTTITLDALARLQLLRIVSTSLNSVTVEGVLDNLKTVIISDSLLVNIDFVSSMPNLTTLNISYSKVQSLSALKVSDGNLKYLTSLDISGNPLLVGNGVISGEIALGSLKALMPQLKELRIDTSDMISDGVKAKIVELLGLGAKLEKLSLRGAKIDIASLEGVVNAVKMPSLTYLRVSDNGYASGNVKWAYIAKVIV